MELNFQYTREEYEKTVEALLRRQRNSPLNLLLFFLMTFGQMGFVIAMILRSQVSGGQAVTLVVLSLLICGVQLVYRYAPGLRARAQTARAIQKGQISEDFWKKQRLSLRDDLVKLRCGKTELSYDCAFFSGSREAGGSLLLLFQKGRTVHQLMVPGSAFSSEEEKQAFLTALREGKKRSILAGMAENRSARPEDALYSVSFSYTPAEFARDQVRAVRTAYTCRVGWPLSQIARCAGALFLGYHLVKGSYGSTGMIVFIVLVLILLLYPLLVSFTPLCRLIVRRNTESLFSGLDRIQCSLDVSQGKLYFIGDTFENTLDLDKLYEAADRRNGLILYWKDNTAITVPAQASREKEARRMYLYLSDVADKNWAARRGKDLLR